MGFLEFVLAVLAGDLLTGVVHWAEDRYCGYRCWEWFDKAVCAPNRMHHASPALFLRGSFWSRNWTSLVPASIAAVIALVLSSPFAAVVFLTAGSGNQVHAWAHGRPAHWAPRMGQEMGLLLSPRQHARHHRVPHDCCYCSVTNAINPIVDRLRLWAFLEAVLASLGIPPRPTETRYG